MRGKTRQLRPKDSEIMQRDATGIIFGLLYLLEAEATVTESEFEKKR